MDNSSFSAWRVETMRARQRSAASWHRSAKLGAKWEYWSAAMHSCKEWKRKVILPMMARGM